MTEIIEFLLTSDNMESRARLFGEILTKYRISISTKTKEGKKNPSPSELHK